MVDSKNNMKEEYEVLNNVIIRDEKEEGGR